MSSVGVTAAAHNNAAWCDALCSAHGRPGKFSSSYWLNRHRTPPHYPNLVTLDASQDAMSALGELMHTPPSASWAVKDSFNVLPLDAAGFHSLFEAEWICRPAHLAHPGPHASTAESFKVQSEPMLEAWEAAWGESLGQPRVFVPPLLRRPDIAILATRDPGGFITAGVIANRTEDVVGLSNFFASADDPSLRAGCIVAAINAFPGLPLVGYEAGKDLAAFQALGFESLGPLRVWITEL